MQVLHMVGELLALYKIVSLKAAKREIAGVKPFLVPQGRKRSKIQPICYLLSILYIEKNRSNTQKLHIENILLDERVEQ